MTEYLLNRFFRRRADVLDHFFVLIPDFGCSTDEFYRSIEEELKLREVPAIEISRVEHSEGSFLSMRREYLRLRRERLLFEICSAPFGTSWFFSCRFSEFRLGLRLWHLLVVGVLLVLIALGFSDLFTLGWSTMIFLGTLLSIVYLLKVVSLEKSIDLDAKFIAIPILGPIYESLFRRNTYFRQDTRIMYCELLDAIVKSKIQEIAGEHQVGKGDVKDIEFKKGDAFEKFSLSGLFQKFGKLCSDLLKG